MAAIMLQGWSASPRPPLVGRIVRACLLCAVITCVPAIASAAAAQQAWEAAWRNLGADDATAAKAAEELAAGGQQTIAFLTAKLTEGPPEQILKQLIAQLDHDEFVVRERATAGLIGLGGAAEKAVRDALANNGSVEARLRLESVLQKIKADNNLSGEAARQHVRAVEVLEKARAFGALADVARRAPWGNLRDRANQALLAASLAEYGRLFAQAQDQARAGQEQPMREVLAQLAAIVKNVEGLDAEAVQACRKKVAALEQAWTQAARLKADLRAADAPPTRIALVRLLLIELDHASAAAEACTDAVPQPLRSNIGLAAGALAKLDRAQCMALARWYVELAGQGSAALGRPNMLARAVLCYEAWLARQPAPDKNRAEVAAALAQVQMDLADAIDVSDSANLLRQADLQKHVAGGTWERGAGVLLKSSEFGLLNLPVRTSGSYELRVQFSRTAGEDGIFIALPAGTGRGNLNLGGWQNTASGIEIIAGTHADSQTDAQAARKEGLENNRVHDLVARVLVKGEQVDIAVTLDGRPFVKWSGPHASLSTHPIWPVAQGNSFAIGAHRSDMTFRSIRLRMLEGKAEKFVPPATRPAGQPPVPPDNEAPEP